MVSSTASCSETPGMVIDQQVKTILTCGLRIQVHDGTFIVSLRCELPGSQWLSPERLMNYKLSLVKSLISHQEPNHFALPELKSSPMDSSNLPRNLVHQRFCAYWWSECTFSWQMSIHSPQATECSQLHRLYLYPHTQQLHHSMLWQLQGHPRPSLRHPCHCRKKKKSG